MSKSELAQRYLRFAQTEARGSSLIYETWARGVAEDASVLALIEHLPVQKRQPNLVFAAARHHGAEGLAYALLREHLLSHWSEIAQTALARATQTNEVARTSVLLPWFSEIAGPVVLVEVGAAAGLCLYPECYAHLYTDGHREVRLDPSDRSAGVVLRCTVEQLDRVPRRLPEVVWRAGIDLNPNDLSDESELAWLSTLV